MSYKSKYKPENPAKYIGNSANIICRSTWERKVCKYLDRNENVVKWASEELAIPYISPVDKKPHRYYPDFIAEIKEKNGDVQTYLIEVKPYKQTRPPAKKSKVTKTYRMNMKTYMINEAKWEAAEKFCTNNDWKFKILTEKNIFRGK